MKKLFIFTILVLAVFGAAFHGSAAQAYFGMTVSTNSEYHSSSSNYIAWFETRYQKYQAKNPKLSNSEVIVRVNL